MKQPKSVRCSLLIWEFFALVMFACFVKERFHPALYYELYEFDLGVCLFPLAVTKLGAWLTLTTRNEFLFMFCIFGFMIVLDAVGLLIRKKKCRKYWIYVLAVAVLIVFDIAVRTVLFVCNRYVYPSPYFYVSVAISVIQLGFLIFYVISQCRKMMREQQDSVSA